MSTEQKIVGIVLVSMLIVSGLATLYAFYSLLGDIFMESVAIVKLVDYSVLAFLIWLAVFFAAYILDWCYAWINDGKMYHRNRLLEWVMHKKGYTTTNPGSSYFYVKKTNNYVEHNADGGGAFCQVSLLVMSLPWVVYFFYSHPTTGLSIGLFIGLMHVARFSIRMAKKLRDHISDMAMHSRPLEKMNDRR